MDHKAKMEEQARLLTSMDFDEIFVKAEQAIDLAGPQAIEAGREDVKEAHGVTLDDAVVHHLLVCGFALALTMAQRSAENYLANGG